MTDQPRSSNPLLEIQRQLDALRQEVRAARAESGAASAYAERLARSLRPTRAALTAADVQSGWDRLAPDVSMVRWRPRQGTVEAPDMGTGLIDRLKAGESVAATDTVSLTDAQNNINVGGNPSMPGAILVYDGTHDIPILSIDDQGIIVYDLSGDPPDPSSYLLIAHSAIYAVRPGYPDLLIADKFGINASAIGGGALAGGSNLIPDGSFESAAFPSTVPSTKTWTATTDWDDATGQVNLAVGGASLTMTTATY